MPAGSACPDHIRGCARWLPACPSPLSASGPVLASLAWAAGIAVVFAPLSVRAFKRRI
ncbi:MAG: hypothetical protein FWJ70_03015 [Micromonosporaceae bacterium]